MVVGTDVRDLVQAADTGLYAARETGCDNVQPASVAEYSS
jgi:hypothetical protein